VLAAKPVPDVIARPYRIKTIIVEFAHFIPVPSYEILYSLQLCEQSKHIMLSSLASSDEQMHPKYSAARPDDVRKDSVSSSDKIALAL
jgi:hypothetical protein